MRGHWGYICENCKAVEFLSGDFTYEKPVLEPPSCSKCERKMQEVPVVEASNQPRLLYLGILFGAALISALVAWLYYTLFEPAGDAEMGPIVGLLFVILMLPAWWGSVMLLVYLIFTINAGVGWLTKRPVLKSPPPWLKPLPLRDEVLREARLSLWLLAAIVGFGLFITAFKLIVGPQ